MLASLKQMLELISILGAICLLSFIMNFFPPYSCWRPA
jgi:hypothetical protein